MAATCNNCNARIDNTYSPHCGQRSEVGDKIWTGLKSFFAFVFAMVIYIACSFELSYLIVSL